MKQITIDFKEYQEELVQSHEDGYAECYKSAVKIINDLLIVVKEVNISSEAIVRAMVWVDDE